MKGLIEYILISRRQVGKVGADHILSPMGPIVGFDYDFSLAAVKRVGFRQKIRPLVRPGGFFSCDIIEVMEGSAAIFGKP